MFWTINYTLRVYLNFFGKKQLWTLSFPVSSSHLSHNYSMIYRPECLPAHLVFCNLDAIIYPFSSDQNSWQCFRSLSYLYLIFNSILICSTLNLRAGCPNIVYIDQHSAYKLWMQLVCSWVFFSSSVRFSKTWRSNLKVPNKT